MVLVLSKSSPPLREKIVSWNNQLQTNAAAKTIPEPRWPATLRVKGRVSVRMQHPQGRDVWLLHSQGASPEVRIVLAQERC